VSALPDAYLAIIRPLIATARGFLEAGETLAPVAFVGNFANGQAVPVLLRSGSEAEKNASAAAIRAAAQALDADFVFVMMEAWSLRQDKLHRVEEIMERYGSIGASPYAIDVVSMALETRHGVWAAQLPIKAKGVSKKKRTFAEPAFQWFTEVEGRFVNLLPARQGEASAPAPLH